MSRQATATVDYFPHIVNGGKTIYVLESKFGNDGYAVWFKIQELIGATDGHYIDCRDLATWEFLMAKCMVDKDKLLNIIQTLANVGAIDGELWEQKVIFCQVFINNVADVYKRRTVKLPTRETILNFCGFNLHDEREHIPTDTGENVDIKQTESADTGENVDKNPQSKLNKTKLEETKQRSMQTASGKPNDEEKEPSDFEFVVQQLGKICTVNSRVDSDMVSDWIETMPRDWIEHAILLAKDQGGKTVRYVDTILQAWVAKYNNFDVKPWEVENSGRRGKNGLSGSDQRAPTAAEYERDRSSPGWGD